MKTNKLLIAFVLVAALLLAGCGPRLRVGALRTESKSVEMDGSNPVKVQVDLGAGDLQLAGGAQKLLESEFTYNVDKLKPEVDFTNGKLVVSHHEDRGYRTPQDIRDFRNEWDLRLNNDVPMNLSLNMGAGTSELELAGLSLTGLDIVLGAGKSTVDLSGDLTQDLDVSIFTGAANITVRLPREVGVRVEVETGLGTVDASGLKRHGNVYTNSAYGESDVTLQVSLESGIGQIILDAGEGQQAQ